MSILYDCHLHTAFSADSETPPFVQVEKALSLGLSGICFTEHEDPDYPPEEGLDFRIDFSSYFSEMNRLRMQYAGRLNICCGMEFGMQSHLSGQLESLAEKYPFDCIIVSQHILNGKDPYYPSYFEGRNEQECYREFLLAQLNNLRSLAPSSYDTLGHLDYIVRYGPNRNRYFHLPDCMDIIDPILKHLIDNGKCLEVNTGGLKYGLGQTNPATDVLLRYRELGGDRITIGSDAHEPAYLAYEFGPVGELLKNLGFRYYAVHEKRVPHMEPL